MQVIRECDVHCGSMRSVLFWTSLCRVSFHCTGNMAFKCMCLVRVKICAWPTRRLRGQHQNCLAILITIACTLSVVFWDANVHQELLYVWDVTFRVLVGEVQRPCWTLLATSIPTGVEATDGLPGSSLGLGCHWHGPELLSCPAVLVDT